MLISVTKNSRMFLHSAIFVLVKFNGLQIRLFWIKPEVV